MLVASPGEVALNPVSLLYAARVTGTTLPLIESTASGRAAAVASSPTPTPSRRR